jgi:hypothetical protein
MLQVRNILNCCSFSLRNGVTDGFLWPLLTASSFVGFHQGRVEANGLLESMECICADWHSKILVALCSGFVRELWSLGPESRNRWRLDITDMSGLRSGPFEAQNLDDPELFPPGFHTIKGFLSAYKNPSLEISAVFPFALPPNSASSALQNFLTMDSALDHSVRRELKALQGIEIFPHSFPNQDSAPISPGFISSESHDGQLDLGIQRAHGGHSTNDDIPLSFDMANIFANNNTLELGSRSLLNNGEISFANLGWTLPTSLPQEVFLLSLDLLVTLAPTLSNTFSSVQSGYCPWTRTEH